VIGVGKTKGLVLKEKWTSIERERERERERDQT